MTKDAPDLAPNKLLSGLKSLFRFSSDVAAEKRDAKERADWQKAEREGPAWAALSTHPGWELMKKKLDAEIDAHLSSLEKGGEDEKLLRAKIAVLRGVLEIVPKGLAAAEVARAALEKDEK